MTRRAGVTLVAVAAVATSSLGVEGCATAPTPRPAPTKLEVAAEVPRPAAAKSAPRPARPALPPLSDGAPSYDLEQSFNPDARTFQGTLRLRFANPLGEPLAAVPLALHANAPAELGAKETGSIALVDATSRGRRATVTAVRPSLVRVTLSPPVPPRGVVDLVLRYTGRLRDLPEDTNDAFAQAMGSFAALGGGERASPDYGLLALGDGILTAATAYPMLAPFREGTFDVSPPPRVGDLVYAVPGAFRVRTSLPAGWHLVTNLVDGAPEPAPAGREVTLSEGTWVRNLVLVAGRDLDHASQNVGGVRVVSHYRARDADAGHDVLEVAAAALASFERRFGPYPWPELDVAESTITGGAGGVEFCAMALIAGMFYREVDASKGPFAGLSGLLGDEETSKAATGAFDEQREFVVAHEVAHQYFAGVVGNDARRHAAVDEPLAQYAARLAIEDRRGHQAGVAALDKHAKATYALYRALGNPDRAAARESRAFTSSIEYGALVYGKAPYLYDALRARLGDAAFDAALRSAVDASRFRTVTLDDWTAAVERGATARKADVRPLFRRFLQETHGDQDLGVDDSGEAVLRSMVPPEMADSLTDALRGMGMTPKDLLRGLGGGLK